MSIKTAITICVVFCALHLSAQTCYTISNRTNGNGNPGTCGSPSCSGNTKTGHIDVSFGASCPGIIPSLQLISVTSGSLPNPFCFDPGNCISAGTVRYCFRGNNLPSSGFMTLRLTQGASVWNCSYGVNGGLGTVLPVRLSYFDTKLQDGNVHVKWRTEQELNNERFEIERSNDNKTFTSIGNVRGRGTSYFPVDYAFDDVSPLKGVSFYRLHQIDIDEKSSYSVVKRVDNRIEGIQLKQLFPNPANEKITMQLIANKLTKVHVVIINSLGQQVISEDKRLSIGEQNWTINLERIKAGVYELILTTDMGGIISEKFIAI